MAPGFTQVVSEMSTKNPPGNKGWPVHRADNLTTICESVVRSLTSYGTLTACYKDSFTSFYV